MEAVEAQAHQTLMAPRMRCARTLWVAYTAGSSPLSSEDVVPMELYVRRRLMQPPMFTQAPSSKPGGHPFPQSTPPIQSACWEPYGPPIQAPSCGNCSLSSHRSVPIVASHPWHWRSSRRLVADRRASAVERTGIGLSCVARQIADAVGADLPWQPMCARRSWRGERVGGGASGEAGDCAGGAH